MGAFEEAAAQVGAPDAAAAAEARRRQDRLTKPAGSLGRLEDAWASSCPPSPALARRRCPSRRPSPSSPATTAWSPRGCRPWPQEVTAQMVANFCAGGAAMNVLARHVGATVVVVDVGVAADLPAIARVCVRPRSPPGRPTWPPGRP